VATGDDTVELKMKSLLHGETLAEIRSRMDHLHPDRQRLWGKMNAHQMMCHLADSFEIALGTRQTTPLKTPLPPALMKWVAFHMPWKWPKNVPTTVVAEQGVGGTPPADWYLDQSRLLLLFETFSAKRTHWASHPMFRSMSTKDWMRWGYLHTDHHLRQFGL
jgi:hypothetical protein